MMKRDIDLVQQPTGYTVCTCSQVANYVLCRPIFKRDQCINLTRHVVVADTALASTTAHECVYHHVSAVETPLRPVVFNVVDAMLLHLHIPPEPTQK
jgi:hypothetical protein